MCCRTYCGGVARDPACGKTHEQIREHLLAVLACGMPCLVCGWQHAGYQLILSVPLVPLTVPSYDGPPEPGQPYQLADYPDALAAFRQGVSGASS